MSSIRNISTKHRIYQTSHNNNNKMPTNNLNFCLATPSDASRLQQLIESSFRATDPRQNWTGDAEDPSDFRFDISEVLSRITGPNSEILVASINENEYVACTTIYKPGGPNTARVSFLAVEPRYQCGGIGRRVLRYAEEYCQRNWGATRMELDALSSREGLIAWYSRCGYRLTGEVRTWSREEEEDLHYVQFEKDLN